MHLKFGSDLELMFTAPSRRACVWCCFGDSRPTFILKLTGDCDEQNNREECGNYDGGE